MWVLLSVVGVAHAEPPPSQPPPSTAPVALAAAPAPQATAAPPAASPPAQDLIGGWHFLATAGFGDSTNRLRHLELAPYGPSFGLDAAYTFRFGLRLGAYFGYSLGRSITQERDPRIGRPFEFTADASSLNTGLLVGYDVPLHFLVLRYSLGLGLTSMHWDVASADARAVGYGDASNPNNSLHFSPGLALLWPHGLFECGVGFDYLIQSSGTVPSGFLGKLLVGVKL
jgi:hypothetical protein